MRQAPPSKGPQPASSMLSAGEPGGCGRLVTLEGFVKSCLWDAFSRKLLACQLLASHRQDMLSHVTFVNVCVLTLRQ